MWKVNTKGKNKIKTLINSGDIDFDSSWSFKTVDEKKLLGEDDWNTYGSVHLAVDSEFEPDTKQHYGYPVAKMKGSTLTVYRQGVIAAKGAAAGARGAEKNEALYNIADMLLSAIDEKMDKADKVCPECGANITEEMKECPDCKADLCGTKKKKKKGDSVDVQRYDLYDFSEDNWMEEKFTRTPEGFLRGRAKVTNVGVFSYVNPDGTIRRELRLPQEVFAYECIDSIKSKPITNEHPTEKVDVENIKKYQVGYTGDEIRTDPYYVSVPMTITDAQAIADIENGKRGLSAGYMVTLDETPGVWLGMQYDAIQKNIKNNHVAIVFKGRAGDAAKMKMDGIENSAYRLVGDSVINIKEENMPELLKKFTIDGVEYQAEGRVIETLNTEKKRADELQTKFDASEKALTDTKTKLSATEAERDTYKAKLDKAENDLKAAKLDDSKIKEAVDKRLNLLTTVYAVGVEVKSDETDQAIMAKVIAKAFPDVKLDGKDNVYIQGMFDGAIGILQKQNDSLGRKIFIENKNDGTEVVNSETAKKNMLARISGAKK